MLRPMKRWVALLLLLLAGCTSSGGSSAGPARRTTAPVPTQMPSPASPSAAATPSPRGDFHPTSTSFVSAQRGWFLGTRDCAARQCPELLETADAGRTFQRRQAPPAAATAIRFADSRSGWAFSSRTDVPVPGLWRTHDAGAHWTKVLARAVPSLEVARGTVWAVVLQPDGTGPELYRGSSSGDSLRRVAGVGNRQAYVVVSGAEAYVVGVTGASPIAPSLSAYSGTRGAARPTPCATGTGPDFDLAASRPGHLVAVCFGEPGAGQQQKAAFRSDDNARSWQRMADPSGGGYTQPGGLAATVGRSLLTGSRSGVQAASGRGPWHEVLQDPGTSGFSYVGMTDDRHGVLIGYESSWMTADGGEHWRRLAFGDD